MNICAISDLHGQFPSLFPCDLLLIAGDICPNPHRPPGCPADIQAQARWLNSTFCAWLEKLPARHIVAVAGNHDFVFERAPGSVRPLRWHYLERSSIEIEGLRIWGSPDQLPFFRWAFNVPEEELRRQYDTIPEGTDIILSHGPPCGYGDLVTPDMASFNAKRNVGSDSLTDFIRRRQPRYVITGHIHEAYGAYELGATRILNAAILDEDYRLVHAPHYFEL